MPEKAKAILLCGPPAFRMHGMLHPSLLNGQSAGTTASKAMLWPCLVFRSFPFLLIYLANFGVCLIYRFCAYVISGIYVAAG